MKSKPNLFTRVSKFALVPSFAAVSICCGGSAFAATWLNSGTTDWNTGSNWTPAGVPTGAAATVNTNTGSIATITATTPNPGDILIGSGGGTNGRVNHTAGSVTTGSWMKIGHNSGTGVYNLADTAGSGGAFTAFGTGSGNINLTGGNLRVGGGDAGSGGNGTMNVNTSGSLTVAGAFHIGTNTSTGVLNFDNGTINLNNNTAFVGNGATGGSGVTGTLNMSGGTLNKVSGNYIRIGDAAANGFLNMTGGTLNNNGSSELQIGNGAGSHGTLMLGGTGTINTASWVSIGRSTGTGTLNVSGGTLTKTNGGVSFIVGDGSTGTLAQTNGAINTAGEVWVGSGTSTGLYNMSGGTFSADSWFVVGRNANSVGIINMSGGTITKAGANDLVVGADSNTANGSITQSGGLINVTAGVTNIGKNAGTGTVTLSGSADFRTTQMVVGAGTGVGTVNFNGGTLETPKLNGGGGTSTVHFNGGTLLATADSTTFVSGLGTADILAGGALLDTQAFTETASQVFSGTGTLTKLGSGTLVLTGDSTHTGLTLVSAGKLVVNTRSTLTAGGFSLENGKTLGVTRRFAEESLNAASLTLGTSASTVTLEMNLGNFGNPLSGGTLRVDGAMTVNANTTINVTDTFPEVGSFPLIQFGSRGGAGTFTLGTLPPGVVAHLDETIDPNAIYLVITQAKLLEWDDSELAGGVWDTANTNWNDLLTGLPAAFTTGAPVSFLDFGTVDNVNPPNPDVMIASGGVSPGTVTFNNSALNYSITGTGGINGTTGLLKQGTGVTTISTSNAYTGVTRLEAGTLSVSSIANSGSPSGIGAASASAANLVFAGGKLSYTGSAATTDRGFTIAAANSVFDVQGAVTMNGPVAASAGQFTKTGAGTLTLGNPGANVLANGGGPGITVNQGSLVLNGGGTQTNSVVNDIFLGMSTATSADLVLTDTTLTSTGLIAIARGFLTPGSTSSCTLNNSTVTLGNISLGWDDNVVGYSATSVLTLNNSTLHAAYNKIAEKGGATSTVVLNGSSTMTANNTDVGQNTGAIGTLDVKGTSVYTSNSRLVVGLNAGSSGTVVIENSGSIVTPASFVSVGFGGGGALTVKDTGSLNVGNDLSVNESGDVPATVTLQNSGTITVAGITFVGRNATRVGTVTQTGGTYTGNGGEFRIGSSGTGTWLQSGGTVNAGGWVSIGRETGGNGVLTVSGGTFNQTGTDRQMVVGEVGTGTLNIQGTGIVSLLGADGVIVSNNATGIGTVNLDGGTLVTRKVSDGGGNSTFNFNGGVLKAGAGANATFLAGIDTAMVKAGGANIDTNGNNIATNQYFGNDGSSGNFTKTGAGTLFMDGYVDILGQAHISAGTVAGIGTFQCPLFVDGASNLNPGDATPGALSATATTFASTSSMTIDLGATGDELITGDLVLNGATLVLNGAATQPVYVIAEYGSLPSGATGKFAGGMSPPALPAGYTIDYAYNGGSQIALVQTATPYTTWAAANITAIDSLADATPNGNPDNDGLTNLAEFGLNGNPLSGVNSGKVVSKVANVGGVPSLVLTLPVRTVSTFSGATAQVSGLVSGIIYRIQGSSALSSWNLTVGEVTGADKTVIETGLPALDSGWSYRTFTTGSFSSASKDFMRAVVEKP